MNIIGIDPGYDRIGIAILEKEKSKDALIFSTCIETNRKEEHAERLNFLAEALRKIIKEYKPDVLAIEKLFFSKNQKTAMKVSEARGVIIECAKNLGLKVREFSPAEIKIAVTGYGASDKKSVMKMVPVLIKMDDRKRLDDEYDAIATAIACSAIAQIPNPKFQIGLKF